MGKISKIKLQNVDHDLNDLLAVHSSDVTGIVKVTQEEYDALEKDPETVYIVEDEDSSSGGSIDVENKADKDLDAVDGNVAKFDSHGNPIDGGTSLSTIVSGAAAGSTAYQKPSSGIPASDIAVGVIPDITGKEDSDNKVTSLSGASTDTQYPSAKVVYDELQLKANVVYLTESQWQALSIKNSKTIYIVEPDPVNEE